MKDKQKIKIMKILLTILIVIILGIFIWKLAPFMTDLSTKEGQIAFKNKISDMGFLGIVLLSGLQIVQILLVILEI